jgi:hypothetical protein
MAARAEKVATEAKAEMVRKGQLHRQAIHGMMATNAIVNQEKAVTVEEVATQDSQEEAVPEETAA